MKVIIETCLLSKDEIITASNIVLKSGADYVKTSTGFSSGGANIDDIILIRETVSDKIGIKASGGIRRLEEALQFISVGATRIGASASVSIMKEFYSKR